MTPTIVAVIAFLAAEPLVALTHRAVMHRRLGWPWHASHHRRDRRPSLAESAQRRFERNDLFPVLFATLTVAAMATGATSQPMRALLWAGYGITAYGAAYLVVHDGYIHCRAGTLPGSGCRYVRWVRAAHEMHHATGKAPYGFLLPLRPDRRRHSRPRDTWVHGASGPSSAARQGSG